MNHFSKVDWEKLNDCFEELQLLSQGINQRDNGNKVNYLSLLYAIESELYILKNEMNLPRLDPSVKSTSAEKSIRRIENLHELFELKSIKMSDYFRQQDYQFWLLPFLLLKHNEIREKKFSLFEIIDLFLERVSEKSFNFEDIVITGSGATRCKTNLRFAFSDLKKVGLVNLYDYGEDHERSWTLSYLGFFVAASFIIKPIEKAEDPLTSIITKFYDQPRYFSINNHIIERIKFLSKRHSFNEILYKIQIENLKLEELEKGSKIFSEYIEYIENIYNPVDKEKQREQSLQKFLTELSERNQLERYVEQLCMKFNAEKFYKDLMESVR